MEAPKRSHDGGERVRLRLVQRERARTRLRCRPGETPPGAHRSAPGRDAPASAASTTDRSLRAQLCQRHFAAARRQFRENRLLFLASAWAGASPESAQRSAPCAAHRARSQRFSRAIHFLRTSAASTGSEAAVAVRSVETLTGSPEVSRSSTRCSISCSSPDTESCRFELLVRANCGSFDLAVDAPRKDIASQIGDAVVDRAPHLGHERAACRAALRPAAQDSTARSTRRASADVR